MNPLGRPGRTRPKPTTLRVGLRTNVPGRRRVMAVS